MSFNKKNKNKIKHFTYIENFMGEPDSKLWLNARGEHPDLANNYWCETWKHPPPPPVIISGWSWSTKSFKSIADMVYTSYEFSIYRLGPLTCYNPF